MYWYKFTKSNTLNSCIVISDQWLLDFEQTKEHKYTRINESSGLFNTCEYTEKWVLLRDWRNEFHETQHKLRAKYKDWNKQQL